VLTVNILIIFPPRATLPRPTHATLLGHRAMIEVQGLTKLYGTVEAVRDLAFRVAPGEVLGLVGPNGAGKTTTLRSIVGIVRRRAGRSASAGTT